MSRLKLNPSRPTSDHLRYFYDRAVIPSYSDKEKVKIDIGQGKTYEIPKINYETKILKPPKRFSYGGRVYQPRKKFLNQNKGLKTSFKGTKFGKSAIANRVKKATKKPSLSFSLQPVALVKPTYGRTPRTFI
tara:strand:+ start:366 stop:761 length:396 start_codon:yes stop_codon:yes gene_type:complete